ncbi:tRNA uridine-5-carboxymethylaminomethyl(34) synthesis GTPase MnmE [Teredinibacter sp. KSP-S5-2]|uniref:tRNA uridine-5-carboxymethylaminomethyl(34) synthesis GTPase MnmE n=1 Tax=Teredinibacter sp. KSP-S5-2 TaxID=3034506 RepID=UPI0029347EDB|nr:tRNA uridine-5-carboxymethylaminomethyl(34) synthesis GTPase MnmE [Teredinibacter sp. KSP-S5-2]WNO09127.1 tRNA uridine-5-carboxymethylaminomethyl(34) synthesis GTPase MnmE [Teredinibacter sp. KSP-S5-2]
MANPNSSDTIAAVATAPGRGGVGIIRVSGGNALIIAEEILGFTPEPRYAHYSPFFDSQNEPIDQGIAIFFPNPHSFTGEDVFELQGHGGPVILDLLLQRIVALGARLARPGEFSERAFLNDKLDLTQAEAIADLINASSEQAAKQALNSLKGEFSAKIDQLQQQLIELRMYVESAIDFPEEEIDFLSDGVVSGRLANAIQQLDATLHQAQQGVLMREGMKVVIAGRPNAGKSSLLNALAEKDIAIVTDIAGTTRDVLREHIHIDGMPLHIVDTAGLRDSPDHVEQIGIERAWQEISEADRILLMIDSTDPDQTDVKAHWPEFFSNSDSGLKQKLTVIFNKVDQTQPRFDDIEQRLQHIEISAKTGTGLDQLKQHLKQVMGFEGTTEGGFSARRRHIDALQQAKEFLLAGEQQLQAFAAGELLAEDLRMAQECLSVITGTYTADDLLGEIFSSFCIGK